MESEEIEVLEETPQYTTIHHKVRNALNLTIFEYCIYDSIYNLSNNPQYNGWCIQSNKCIAEWLGCSERWVREAKKKGIEKGLLEVPGNKRYNDTRIRTTQLWYDNVIIEKERCGTKFL